MATVTLTQSSFPPQRIALHKQHDPEFTIVREKTRAIVYYYIPFHLRNSVNQESLRGLPKNFLVPPKQPCELFQFIAKLCTQLEETNASFFNGLPERVQLKNDNAKRIFFQLCSETFHDNKIGWGRIVSLFTLAGCLAVHFVKKHQLNIVEKIPLWLMEFIDNNLTEWIQQQQGWDDLPKKLSNGSTTPATWSRALAFGGMMAAAGFLLLTTK